jgi:hypothetical protein
VTEGWLATAHAALTRRINDTIDNYDNAKLTLDDAKLFVRSILKSALDQVYTQGYNDGLENDEYEDDEEIELVDDDEEGDEDDA